MNTIDERYRGLFNPYAKKIADMSGNYTVVTKDQLHTMPEHDQLRLALANSMKDDEGGGASKKTEYNKSEMLPAITNQTSTEKEREELEKLENHKSETLPAITNQTSTEKEREELEKEIKQNYNIIKNTNELYLSMSVHCSELINKIDNYKFNIKGYTDTNKEHKNYLAKAEKAKIIEEMQTTLATYISELAEMEKYMTKLKRDKNNATIRQMKCAKKLITLNRIFPVNTSGEIKLIGGAHSNEYNKRKYLKYKNKYLQLKNKILAQ